MTTYQMARGESKMFTFTVTNAAGELVDLTNAKITFTVRGLDGEIVLAKNSEQAGGSSDEIEIPDQAADSAELKGTFYLKIGHDDSSIEPTARWADCWVVTDATPPEYLQVDAHSPFYITDAETRDFV